MGGEVKTREQSDQSFVSVMSCAADSERVAYVCDALRDKGWCNVDPASVDCTLFHGSNNKVFRVSAPGAETVALRVKTEESAEVDQRAKELFSEHGLGPRQLHRSIEKNSEEWCIEEWIGDGHPELKRIEGFAQWGELCAKIHRLPTNWFEEYRTKLQTSVCPEYFRGLRPDHTVWAFSKGDAFDFREMPAGVPQPAEEIKMHLDDPFWLPTSAAGKRVVTTHGDFHPHNLQVAEGKLKCVDLEYTCVASAVVDLAYAMAVIDGMWLVQCHGLTLEENFADIGEKKRAFIRAYLRGMTAASSADSEGYPSEEAVEELLLDAHIAMPGGLWSPIGLYKKGNNMFGKPCVDPSTDGYKSRFAHLKSLVQLARNTELKPDHQCQNPYRESILKNGCWPLFVVEKEYVVLIETERNDPYYVPLVFEHADDMRCSQRQSDSKEDWRPLLLKSHPGKAVVLSEETWVNKMGACNDGPDVRARTLVIASTLSHEPLQVCWNPSSGYVKADASDENRVLTCWSFGCWHGNGPMIVFDREGSTWPESINWPAGLMELPENPHGQKFEINMDGTMSPSGRPGFVLGTQTRVS